MSEWVRVLVEHPDAFEDAKGYEKTALAHGSPFTWSHGESLDELARPERVAQIRSDHERRIARLQARRAVNALHDTPIDTDEGYGDAGKMCVTCHKDRKSTSLNSSH